MSLEPGDGELLRRMFYRLSPESAYRRFFSPVFRPDQFSASELRVDHHDREAIAAVEGGEIIGVAEYARVAGCRRASLTVVGAAAWQRQDLGSRLVAGLSGRARAGGVSDLAPDVQ